MFHTCLLSYTFSVDFLKIAYIGGFQNTMRLLIFNSIFHVFVQKFILEAGKDSLEWCSWIWRSS